MMPRYILATYYYDVHNFLEYYITTFFMFIFFWNDTRLVTFYLSTSIIHSLSHIHNIIDEKLVSHFNVTLHDFIILCTYLSTISRIKITWQTYQSNLRDRILIPITTKRYQAARPNQTPSTPFRLPRRSRTHLEGS